MGICRFVAVILIRQWVGSYVRFLAPMSHLRIISIVWMFLGGFGACWSIFDFSHNLATQAFASAITSDIIALTFCLAASF